MKYKKITKFLAGIGVSILASTFVLSSSVFASVNIEQEYPGFNWYIPTFEVDMKVGRNGVLDVTERIVADFSNTSRRGIIREIPFKYTDLLNGQARITPVDLKDVTGFTGTSWQYDVSNNGDYKNIRIGNPNIYYSEPLNYEITYSVENIIDSYNVDGAFIGPLKTDSDSFKDRLNWNAIGTEWGESPIGFYEVRVDLSEFSQEEILGLECYMGVLGSTDTCEFVQDGDSYVVSGPMLGYQEGVSVEIDFEGGVIVPEWSWSVFFYSLMKYLVFTPIISVFFCYWLWRNYGKEFPKKTVIPTYKLAADLRAIEVGAFVDERFNNEDVTAGLIDMAVRGYIDIKEIPKKGMFGSKSFKFTKKKSFDDDELLSFEKKLLKGLFGSSSSVNSKDLVGKFHLTVSKVKKDIFKYLVKQKYYVKNPNLVFGKYIAIGSMLSSLGVWGAGISQNVFVAITLVPLGLGMLIISPFMSKKTKYGMERYSHILGFKEFIKVAENDRVKFFQNLKDDMSKRDQIKTFEKLLPFAVAYGMGDKWSDLFGNLLEGYNYSPTWYSGNNFQTNNFSQSLNNMSRTVKSASVPPSSSGSSGGGGFSGGGFGGGGGSSW